MMFDESSLDIQCFSRIDGLIAASKHVDVVFHAGISACDLLDAMIATVTQSDFRMDRRTRRILRSFRSPPAPLRLAPLAQGRLGSLRMELGLAKWARPQEEVSTPSRVQQVGRLTSSAHRSTACQRKNRRHFPPERLRRSVASPPLMSTDGLAGAGAHDAA